MDKIEKLRNLKSMLDEGVLTEIEFLDMKNEIIRQNSNNEIVTQIKEEANTPKGNLKIRFEGQWFIIDARTELFINGEFHSTHSTKKGFEVDIPLNVDTKILILEVVLKGIINRSTMYEIEELNPSKNYTMELNYSDLWGKYSNKFYLTENDQNIITSSNFKPNNKIKAKESYAGWIVAIIIVLILTLPFHYVFYQHDFTMFPKNQVTFSNTILTDDDIEGLIKRYNDASLYEKQAINNEPLMRKLREKGIVVEKGLFDK